MYPWDTPNNIKAKLKHLVHILYFIEIYFIKNAGDTQSNAFVKS